ncbi:MAG: oxidoreductase [Geminicoccaceae bacterium]|nr:oxidoreductase [Geminicoccaceae bacterium]
MDPTTIGIIGCGDISHAYLRGAARSQLIRVKACADLRPAAAEAQAKAYGVAAVPVDALLADPEIEIVINLTVPLAHGPVSRQIITADKHVYSEKHQACRRAIDAGRIGRPLAGAAAVLSHGMEHWHPNPEFFFKRGGGPIHDIGPYYVTQLINLLGPVARVAAQASTGSPTRTVSSKPRAGQVIEVEVPTTVNGVLSFASGANVALTASWDVWKHKRLPLEVYGSEGSLLVPDPNFFGGAPMIAERDSEWQELDISAHPFGIPNRALRSGAEVADYRIIGLLDMAAALRQGRPHRASGDLALHVLEVLDSFERSSVEGHHVMVESPGERPEPLPLGAGDEVFLEG